MRVLSACTSIRAPSIPTSSIQPNRARVVRLNCTTPPNTASLRSDFQNLGEPASLGDNPYAMNPSQGRIMMKRFTWLLLGGRLAVGLDSWMGEDESQPRQEHSAPGKMGARAKHYFQQTQPMLFHNSSREAGKKIVQANSTVDF